MIFLADTDDDSIKKIELKSGKTETVQCHEPLSTPWDLCLGCSPQNKGGAFDTLFVAMAGKHQVDSIVAVALPQVHKSTAALLRNAFLLGPDMGTRPARFSLVDGRVKVGRRLLRARRERTRGEQEQQLPAEGGIRAALRDLLLGHQARHIRRRQRELLRAPYQLRGEGRRQERVRRRQVPNSIEKFLSLSSLLDEYG